MPDIARLDDKGVCVAVETVTADAHRTDPVARTVALPDAHDMHRRIGEYFWEWNRGTFLPVSVEPLDQADRETPGLVEGLVSFVEAMEAAGTVLPGKTKKALRAYRATVEGRRRPR
jgi:hypothetical protein